MEEFYTNENSEEEHQQVEHVQAESKARTKSELKFNQGDGFVAGYSERFAGECEGS